MGSQQHTDCLEKDITKVNSERLIGQKESK